MPSTDWAGIYNAVANTATLFGGGAIIYILILIRQQNERLEHVIAPKTGIEGFLNMCAQVVEADPDGACIVRDDGEIVLVNKKMEDICGYHRSELIGQPVEILVPDVAQGTHRGHREGFIIRPSSRPMRGLKLRHKRGMEIPVGINLNHYIDSTGGYTIAKVRTVDEQWSN